mmetsp:Transcript_41233/g.116679  ORF Transcript_41233/g.116679 Transcript_41233/m.116679 type:complete len:207 (-) Transcript_41233:126-746(-)
MMSKLVSLVLLFFASVAVANGFFIQGRPTSPSSAVFKASPVETPATAMPEVKVGDKIPSVVMMEGLGDFEKQEVNIAELIAGKKVAIFGVPGAFTPGCSKSHLPSFIEAQAELKDKGVELTICIATNDLYVMDAWGRTSGGADAGIRFLSDSQGELTEALGLTVPSPMMPRTKRFSLIAEDGVVTHYFSSAEASSDTWAPAVLAKL